MIAAVKDEEGVTVVVTVAVTVTVIAGVLLDVWDFVRLIVEVRLGVPVAVWIAVTDGDLVLTAVIDPVPVVVGVRVPVTVPDSVMAAEPLDEIEAVLVGIPRDRVGVSVDKEV